VWSTTFAESSRNRAKEARPRVCPREGHPHRVPCKRPEGNRATLRTPSQSGDALLGSTTHSAAMRYSPFRTATVLATPKPSEGGRERPPCGAAALRPGPSLAVAASTKLGVLKEPPEKSRTWQNSRGRPAGSAGGPLARLSLKLTPTGVFPPCPGHQPRRPLPPLGPASA